MQYTISQLRQTVFKEVFQVYEVFQNYFGEEYTDLQGLPPDEFLLPNEVGMEELSAFDMTDECLQAIISRNAGAKPFILVYWPRVKVTNEHDKSIYIQDLYAKIELDANGFIPVEKKGFTLNRATYTTEQWESNYLHSHIRNIPKSDLQHFQEPCLGSGPIVSTILSLKSRISEGFDEVKWMLFCEELSRYVTVESLIGIPYKYLERVGSQNELREFSYSYRDETKRHIFSSIFPPDTLKNFILYYLEKGHLTFNFQNGEFQQGMPYFDFIVDISNSFIEYFNTFIHDENLISECFCNKILVRTVASGNKFFKLPSHTDSNESNSAYIGRKVCMFKGREITLQILDNEQQPVHETILISSGLAMYILNNILKIINYHYTNEYNRQQGTAALPAITGQRIYYI